MKGNGKAMNTRIVCILLGLLFILQSAPAREVGHLVRSPEDGWPQFRGPWRDGLSRETGLLGRWPEGGPNLVWSVSGLGQGYSAPIIADGRLYITGDVGDELVISAFDLDGGQLWKTTNGSGWEKPWPGSRASCTYYKGRLFHSNAHGRVACMDPKTGAELWAVDTLERFEGTSIKWGLSECLLVDDDRVFVTPGGKKAFMAALDTSTGKTIWKSKPLRFKRTYVFGGKTLDEPVSDIDKAGYGSAILFESGGRRLIARTAGQHVVCIDADDGEMVWTHPVYAKYEVIGMIPVFWKDRLFIAAPDDFGGRMFRVRASAESVRIDEMWETAVDNGHGAMVMVDGLLYGAGYRRLDEWACIDAKTGKIRYTKDDLVKGSSIFADGRLYALAESGILELLRPGKNGFKTTGRLRVAEGDRRDVWAHPVICDGRLYLRDHDTLWCYDIKKQ